MGGTVAEVENLLRQQIGLSVQTDAQTQDLVLMLGQACSPLVICLPARFASYCTMIVDKVASICHPHGAKGPGR
jgi:hypothetical protein